MSLNLNPQNLQKRCPRKIFVQAFSSVYYVLFTFSFNFIINGKMIKSSNARVGFDPETYRK